ncbi:hypothetical protein KACHI17_01500 [Sediminibacterium sp. KACHI17]|jgi:hypothetical protein|uniref:Uncharacterized protein n=1 Tax=Sediminibacterium sp. KACHI17 TaxID=1751071 RepID=A0AAT9GFB3_9BACT
MKTFINSRWIGAAVLALSVIGFSAWKAAGESVNPPKPFSFTYENEDTTKSKKKFKVYSDNDREYKVGDLDKALKDLDKATLELDRELKMDFSKMEKDMKKAMEEMKKIDVEGIKREIESAMKEVQAALREIDFKDIHKEVEKEMVKVKEELKSEKIKHNIDVEGIRKEVEKGMAEAKEGIREAKKQIAELKAFVDELDKDGLIDKDKSYKIQIKNKKMFINGKEQSAEVNKKYSKYLDKEDYSIEREED